MPDVKGPVASNGAVVPAAATAHPNSKKALQKLEVEEQIEADKNEELNHLRDQAWGRYPKLFIWLGISLMWTIFELDNATVYNYQNYATSEFQSISYLGTLTTAGTILSAVLKPPIAKLSDVIGRAETYAITVCLYILSYILASSSHAFNQYSASYIIYCIGQTGMQILNQIIVADITSSRTRGLANGLVNLPFMIVPWIAAFIVDSALTTVGWRWGIGMFAFILPTCSAAVIIPLALFQRRMARSGAPAKPKLTLTAFLSHIDLPGVILLAGGFALVLLPLSLAGNAPSRWSTPWIPAVIAVGTILLLILPYYSTTLARHPILPPHLLRNTSLLLAWAIGTTDSFAFSATHTYMYPWAVTVHGFSPRDATFLTFTAGCMQVLSGAIVGYLMYRFLRFKLFLVVGVMIRLIGYGTMLRLRGADNSAAELFAVQLIQGFGSGIILTIVLVMAQIVVTRKELAQSTALMLQFIYLGNALGSAVAGGIYTGLLRESVVAHTPSGLVGNEEWVERVYNSIVSGEGMEGLGVEGSRAVEMGFTDVMRYMTLTALGAAVIPVLLVWFVKDLKLAGERHNLAEEVRKGRGEGEEAERVGEGRWRKGWRTGRWW